jgi:hypothetical protein
MTAITFGAVPRKIRRTAKPQRFIAAIARALDAYVAYRVQKAVPEAELLRAAQTIKRLARSTEYTRRPVR